MKVNVITFLFVISVVLKFGNYSEIFACIVGTLVSYYLLTAQKEEYDTLHGILKDNKLLAFAYFSSLLSTIANSIINSRIGINYILEIVLFGLITLLGILVFNRDGKKYIIEGINQIVFILLLFSFVGVVEFIIEENVFYRFVSNLREEYLWNTGTSYRISTIFIHPIPCANVYFFGLMAVFYLMRKNTYRLFCIFLFVINIFLTQSRSVWLAAILVPALYYISKYPLNVKSLFVMIIKILAIVVVMLVMASQIDIINEILIKRFTDTDNSLNEDYSRIASIIYILNLYIHSNIFNIIFGHGNHASSFAIEKVDLGWKDWNTTDNLYLSDLFNFGVIYVIIIVCQFLKMLKQYKDNRNHSSIIVFSVSVFLGFAMIFFFYEPFVHYPVVFLFFFSLGLFLSANNKNKNKIRIRLPLSNKMKLILLIKYLERKREV